MNVLEIVFGHSCYYTMKRSNLSSNNIIMFNVLFNISDLSNVENFRVKIPEQLFFEEKNINFKEEYDIIINNIKEGNKIRIWTSRKDIYSYLLMLYVCNIINTYNYELYVLYSDDYNKDFLSPSVMMENELEKLSMLEYKLTNKEISDNASTWKKLVYENSDLRVIEGENVKSVSLNYYNSYILDTLQQLGKVKMSELVGTLMSNVYLNDITYVYLIERLIDSKKIKITLNKNIRYFENLVEINN